MRAVLALVAAVGIWAYAFSAEAAVGVLGGRLTAEHTGRPLAGVRVYARPRAGTAGETRRARTDGAGRFDFGRVPAGAYELRPATQAYVNRPQEAVVAEGAAARPELRLRPEAPFLNLHVHQHVYAPGETPRVALHGFRQGETVRLSLRALDGMALVRDHGSDLRALLRPVSASGVPGAFRRLAAGAVGSGARPAREWRHAVRSTDAEGVFYEFVRLDRVPPGVYLLSADGAVTGALGWLMVTDLALVTKRAGRRLVAYAVDLRSGAAVPGTAVSLFQGRRQLSAAMTGPQGVAELRAPGGDAESALFARRGASLAFTRLWGGSDASERYRVFTYTDRPVYRPGHRVRFKGIVRRLDGRDYRVPEPGSATFEVRDPQGTEISGGELVVSARGSFDGGVDLPTEAASGYYQLTVRLAGEEHGEGFAVAAYRKPEWRVEVSTPAARYVRGESVPVSVSAEYYFGAPVVGGRVRYTVYRTPYYRWWPEGEQPAEEDAGDGFYGEVVAEGETVTDGGGAAQFRFSTVPAADPGDRAAPAEEQGIDYRYNIEAEVADLGDRVASGRGRVVVARGLVSLDVRPAAYVTAPGQETRVTVRALDLEEHPAADTAITAAASVQAGDGTPARELARAELRADSKGEVVFSFTPPATGLVAVTCRTTDRRGNRIAASTDLWVSSAEGAGETLRYPSLSLLPDRRQYRIGETAQVLLNTDRPGATALVAVEAKGILELRTVPIRRRSTVLRFPIRAGWEPNVFVSACFVREKEFVSSQAALRVDAGAHRLRVTVEPDRRVYQPRDPVTWTLRTTDAAGRPVPAECSFALVDEAVFAIREAPREALWKAFYPRRYNAVSTEYSFPMVYLGDAGKDGGQTVRRHFPDTARWEPVVQTGADGQARLTMTLPDSLTTWRATVLAHSERTEVGEGLGSVRVSKELSVRLQVPRALTEGDRLTVTAVVHNECAKPVDVDVQLRAEGLRLLAAGRTHAPGAPGHPGTRRVRVFAGDAARLTWEAEAAAPGTARLTVLAAGPGLSDGTEATVPVRPFVREQVVFRAGTLTGDEPASAEERFTVDPDTAGGQAELRLSPTLAGTLLGGLEYLATYPHGCTEQTMSGFLPDVAIGSLLRDLKLRRPELEQSLPEMVRSGLLRLYRYQHPDGGWGWWEHDESEPWMTAYVLYGMQAAREAGYPVNDAIYRSGLERAAALARDPRLATDDAMLLAYTLVRGGASRAARPLLARLERRARNGAPLPLRSVGYGLLALAATRRPADREAGRNWMLNLWEAAVSDDAGTRWHEPRRPDDYTGPADIETTAVLLRAALALTPEHPRLPEVVRWLLLKRRGGRWESTRDTAWVLLAMADYLRATGELRPDCRVTVLLNGRTVHEEKVSESEALAGDRVLTLPLPAGGKEGRLEVRKDGAGTLYYSLQVTSRVRAPSFAAESAVPGLRLTRQYLPISRGGRGAPESRPVDRARVGDRLLVRLRLHTDRPLEFLLLEDPLPAGFEVLERGDVERDEWSAWWSHLDVRDDRVNVFIRSLEPGDHDVEYYVRPETAGRLRVLPAVVTDMYAPSLRASTADARFTVAP